MKSIRVRRSKIKEKTIQLLWPVRSSYALVYRTSPLTCLRDFLRVYFVYVYYTHNIYTYALTNLDILMADRFTE